MRRYAHAFRGRVWVASVAFDSRGAAATGDRNTTMTWRYVEHGRALMILIRAALDPTPAVYVGPFRRDN